MNYRPEHHAAALSDWTALLQHQAREIAALRGDVARLVAALPRTDGKGDEKFDQLLSALYACMGASTWIVREVDKRMLRNDQAGLKLLEILTRLDKVGTNALGIYLSRRVPGGSRVSAATGLEIRRGTLTDNCVTWTISRV